MILYPQQPVSVKSRDLARLDLLFQRARVKAESVKRVAKVALATAGVGGEVEAEQLCELTGYSRVTVDRACRRLVGLGGLTPVPRPARGRGHKAAFTVTLGKKPRKRSGISRHERGISRIRSSRNPENPNSLRLSVYKDLKSTQSKDQTVTGRSQGVRQSLREKASVREKAHDQSPPLKRSPLDYQGSQADTVTLVMGARFYRRIMRAIRLGFESWELSEPIRDAIEGFFGLRIDGASLNYARELKEKLWALRSEIEALAASGASPRRVCSFVAGRLAGIPEHRSKREVLKRTAQLLTDVEQLERRIAGLKVWLREREREYHEGRVCSRCGHRHSTSEYQSGYKDDGGLNCFGFARIKLEELQEHRKLRSRQERCRLCGGSLNGGHVNGVCWSCYDSGKNAPRVNGLQLLSESAGVDQSIPIKVSKTAVCRGCKIAPATAYGYCDACRKRMVRRALHGRQCRC